MSHTLPSPEVPKDKLPDMFNPVEIAKYGFKKSTEALRALLSMKSERTKNLEAAMPRNNQRDVERMAIARKSIDQRLELSKAVAA